MPRDATPLSRSPSAYFPAAFFALSTGRKEEITGFQLHTVIDHLLILAPATS